MVFKKSVYLATALAYISQGMQLVLVVWMAVVGVEFGPIGVSGILAAMMLPQVTLLPFSGRWADQYPPSRLAKWGCIGLAASHLLLVASIHAFTLHWLSVLIYAIALGAFSAIFLPSKDKATIQLFPNRLQKTISLSSAFQFSGVFIGALIAGFVNDVGITGLLILQCLIMAVAASHWSQLSTKAGGSAVSLDGYGQLIRENKTVFHLLILCAFNGFLQMGFAVALFPELGMNYWGFTAIQYGLMQGVFYLGAVVVYLAKAYKAPQQHPGQAVLFCLLYTAAITYAITQAPTLYGSYGLIFLWGAVAGYSAAMSRVVLHSVVVDSNRGRAAALYQTTLLALAPLGALACGAVLEFSDINQALLIISLLSVIMFAGFLFSRPLWRVKGSV